MPEHSISQVGVRQLVPLLMIANMDASLRYYVDGLGFTIANTWTPEGRIRWCWLEHGTAALMLQETADETRRAELRGKAGMGVGLNFQCADALAFYHVMNERGIAVRRPFVGNGMWVVSLSDPDGYSLHFQSVTEVPEETVYRG